MTPEELQEVVAAVIAALKTNSKTIDQLTAVTTLADTDNLEISGGKKVSFGNLKELVASSVVPSSESIKGWVIIEDTDELPENPTQEEQEIGYLLDTTLYVYVGEGGDTLDGKYQSVDMQGPQGETGPAGADGHDGVDLGEVALVNNLTEGGEESALTAEQGKFVAQKTMKMGEATTSSFNAVLEQGAMMSDGTKQPSSGQTYNYRVRTQNFIRVYGSFSVSVNTGYSFNVFFYTAKDTATNTGSLGSWNESYSGSYDGYILVGVRKGTGTATVTPNEVTLSITETIPSGYASLDIEFEQGGLSINGEAYQELPSTSEIYSKRVRSVDLLPVHGKFTIRGNGGKSVFGYDENGIWQKRITTGTWEYGDYSNTHNGYIRITCKKEDDSNCSPSDFHMTLLNPFESRIESAESSLCGKDSSESTITYQGEKICPQQNVMKVNTFCTLPSVVVQSFAIYGEYILLFEFDNSKAMCKLYKLTSMELLATLNLPNSTYKRAHCNACSFSDVFNSADSIMPLLYLSQWDNDSEHGCFVYDFKLTGSTYSVSLVQTILPTNVPTAKRGVGQTDWAVDPLGYIYSIGYLLDDGAAITADNKTMICKYALPAMSDGAVVTFSDADVIDNFDVPIFTYRQDIITNNGKILMLAGHNLYSQCWLIAIDPITKQIVSKVCLDDFNQEPEGIGVQDGKLVVGFHNNAVLYQFDFI